MTAAQPADQHIHALVAAARMYYEQEMSQDEIAKALGKSRPTISRMLTAARRDGIVHIDIRVPFDRQYALERALQDRFSLRDVRVVQAPAGQPDSVDYLGRAAANYLHSVLQDDITVGVSNGRSVAATAKFLEPERSLHLNVVQIIGALGNDNPAIDGPDIARALAAAYDTQCRYLHVPLVVETAAMRQMLVQSRHISQTLRMGAASDVVLVGVGSVEPTDRSPIFDGFLTQKEIAAIRQAGAVGHICGEFYSETGARMTVDINDRTIGIGLAAVKKVPLVVAVAGGATKAAAIVAGIRGGYLNTLITDDRAAERMLQLSATPVGRPASR